MAQQPEVAAPGGWLCINGMFGTERAIIGGDAKTQKKFSDSEDCPS